MSTEHESDPELTGRNSNSSVALLSTLKPHSHYLRLHRKQRLESLVSHRLVNISYLKKVTTGGRFWLNCYYMSSSYISSFLSSSRSSQSSVLSESQIVALFYLGVGITKVIDSFDIKASDGTLESTKLDGFLLVQALSQLFEEWEYSISGAAVQVI